MYLCWYRHFIEVQGAQPKITKNGQMSGHFIENIVFWFLVADPPHEKSHFKQVT